jgi:hypothetical protein
MTTFIVACGAGIASEFFYVHLHHEHPIAEKRRTTPMPLRHASPALDDSTGEHQAIADRVLFRVAINFGGLTDTGKLRDKNEDHFVVATLAPTPKTPAPAL